MDHWCEPYQTQYRKLADKAHELIDPNDYTNFFAWDEDFNEGEFEEKDQILYEKVWLATRSPTLKF
ncbi:MAG: hypothetical protein WBB28_02140 [Crinalium sp.]